MIFPQASVMHGKGSTITRRQMDGQPYNTIHRPKGNHVHSHKTLSHGPELHQIDTIHQRGMSATAVSDTSEAPGTINDRR